MSEQRATAYFRNGYFYIHSSSKTIEWVWVADRPFLRAPEASDDTELGMAIRAALAASRVDIEHPDHRIGVIEPLLQLAGVPSGSTFAKNASCARIELAGNSASIVPMRNLGVKKGFQPLPGKEKLVLLVEASALGAAVRTALLESSPRTT